MVYKVNAGECSMAEGIFELKLASKLYVNHNFVWLQLHLWQ